MYGRGQRWPTHEEIAENRRQRDQWLAEHTANKPKAQAKEYDANGTWKYAGVAAELKAANEGRELGQRFGGDPWRAARALGIPIERYPARVLAQMAGRPSMGRYLFARRVIQLADNLSAHDARQTLAHEIGHRYGHGIEDDAHAEVFMRAFLAQTPPHPMLAAHKARLDWEERLRKGARR